MNTIKPLFWSLFGIIALISFGCTEGDTPVQSFFQRAEAIWPEALQYEKNITVGFRAGFQKPSEQALTLKIAGSSLYRIYLNGQFAGHGPARAGHGFYRVDEWDLSEYMVSGENILAIEAVGYNINSYYLLDQPSFVQAELVSGNEIIAATNVVNNDFEVILLKSRVQKVPKYSFQRTFVEYYQLQPGFDAWMYPGEHSFHSVATEYTGQKELLERRAPYPEFNQVYPIAIVSEGKVKTGIKRERYWKDRAVVNIGEKQKGFTEDQLVLNPAIDVQEMDNLSFKKVDKAYRDDDPYIFSEDGFGIFDFGINYTGFIGAEVEVSEGGRLYLSFDEMLNEGGDVNFRRMGTINIVTYDLEPGHYRFESIEPYTLRYLKAIMTGGACTLKKLYIREFVNPDVQRASFESSDPRLNRIFEAGVETYRQNAVDIFMDCPSRERAGWLCDSYFMAKAAMSLSGNTTIEKNFFENFQLPATFKNLPEGMLPMCYPADHYDGRFIPNWAMWFVIQLKEYLERSEDTKLVEDLRPKVLALIEYFKAFKNSDGLLENLESWIFIEWSEANKFVQDVNYPSNMLYAAMLEVAGELYELPALRAEAAELRNIIRTQSYNGEFFIDNAVRGADGVLRPTENMTEICQYYAYFFDIASPDSHPELWKKLSTEFGPGRIHNNPYPDVHFANAFIGNYLRLELLSRYGLRAQLLAESIDFFYYMAERTGTLWENISTNASLNHGFASHINHVLYRDVLGIGAIDQHEKKVSLIIPDIDLTFCKGATPAGNDMVHWAWEKSNESVMVNYKVPPGFEVEILNETRLSLIEQ
jgi:alpha-L-rhamnosidase